MEMHGVCAKEQEGAVQNPSRSVPWWTGLVLGSQTAYGESFSQSKSSSSLQPAGGDQRPTTKQADHYNKLGLEKGTTPQFTIFPGDYKSLKSSQSPAGISMQSAPVEYQGSFELGFGQSLVCTKYPYGDQYYGLFSACGPQIPGRVMLPLNLSTDDGPIFVNAKQYHGIMRRRQSRAKAEVENKALRRRKPYLHLSRHLHAMRRPRGSGGRFLNIKTPNGSKDGSDTKNCKEGQLSQLTESQNSEVVQSDSGSLNSPKEANGCRLNLSGSEVTSIYSRGILDRFRINQIRSSVHPASNMMTSGHGHGILMPGQWVAAADSCYNLKV